MTASEKVAYLKGLAEGLGIDKEKGEGKVINAIIDVLEDLAYGLEDVEADVHELNDGLDAVSDDLSDVEEFLFGDEDEDEDDCCCGHDEDEDEEYSVVCPACDEEFSLDEDDLEAGVVECPNCGETLELEFDDDGGDDLCCEDDDDDDGDGDVNE